MKLATLRDGSRDGQLLVVTSDMTRALPVPHVARTLQAALDDWPTVSPRLQLAAVELEGGPADRGIPFDPRQAMAPLPRAYHWVDGSAYVNHVELVRKARGVEMPPSFWTDPLVYQGGSDDLLGPTDDAHVPDEAFGIDLEAEIAVVTDDVPMGVDPDAALAHVRLVLVANDWSLRNLIPSELGKGFGFYQSKPATSFSPVAVTPDELGDAWHGGRVHLPLVSHVNGNLLGRPEAGEDMTFGFGQLVSHACRTRRLRAGSIVGSGTVSNYERSRGSACLAERRMLEQIETGRAVTPFLSFGDRVRIEMLDRAGRSVCGAIDQRVVRSPGPA
jgi:fumarylacetoacetate (FAA) hydrolase